MQHSSETARGMDRSVIRRRLMLLGTLSVVSNSCGSSNDPPGPLRLAPEACPADPVTHEAEPWTEPEEIILSNGRSLVLRGCRSQGDGWIEFVYRGEAPRAGLYLIEYSLYEGGGWVVVDSERGQVQYVSGEPVFSPGGTWFATGAVDLEAQYDRNHLDIWRVGPDTISRAVALDGLDEWGATDLQWAQDDVLNYLRVDWSKAQEPDRWLDTTQMRVVFDGAMWQEGPRE